MSNSKRLKAITACGMTLHTLLESLVLVVHSHRIRPKTVLWWLLGQSDQIVPDLPRRRLSRKCLHLNETSSNQSIISV